MGCLRRIEGSSRGEGRRGKGETTESSVFEDFGRYKRGEVSHKRKDVGVGGGEAIVFQRKIEKGREPYVCSVL